MALSTLFIDGFDHYASAELLAKWSGYTSAAPYTIATDQSRHGSQALKIGPAVGSNNQIWKTLPMQAQTLVAGFAFRPGTSGVAGRGGLILGSGGVGLGITGKSQIVLHYQANNTLAVRRAGTGTSIDTGALLGASTTALTPGTWYHVELRVYLHDTAGEWELRINGVTEASGSGVDTKERTETALDTIGFDNPSGGSLFYHIDDLYIRGDTVLTAGGFLGDCKVLTKYPQGAGSSTQFAVSGAAANWQAVDEAPPNGDTDYVHSDVTGNKDLYDFAALGDSNPIKAVQLCTYARKDDAGTRTLALRVKSGATQDASAAKGLSTNYTYLTHVWESDPNTASDWTETALNAAELGFSAEA